MSNVFGKFFLIVHILSRSRQLVLLLLCQILNPSSKIPQFKPMLKFISLKTKIIYFI